MKGRDKTAEWVARGMGLFGLGVGLPAVTAPDGVAQLMGLPKNSMSRTTLCAIGLRQTAFSIGILAWPRFAGWMWGRVAGDAMDLAILGSLLATSTRRQRGQLAAVTAGAVSSTAIDMWTAIRLSRRAHRAKPHVGDYEIEVKRAITVNRPREELYHVWHDFRNLPRFMEHLVSVELLEGNRSRWVAKTPAGATAAWDVEVVEDQPNERIAWRSLPGNRIDNAGSVRFLRAPGDKGTEIHVEVRYNLPGGRLGTTVARIFGKEPGQQVANNLRRFKQVMETGEIIHSDASARDGGAAQPPEYVERAGAIHSPAEPTYF